MELRIEHLTKTYPNGVRALHDVTLTIPRGMFGLLGPNGAGKSTLMRTIATLQEPDTGSIILGDPPQRSGDRSPDGSGNTIDVIREKDRVRRTLGYLPQEFGVYPSVSAERLLDHFAVLEGFTDRAARRRVVEALLRQTNLWDVRKQRLGGYSGGMRQRFGIAQALIGNPALMIVDEPTAGLDPEERNRFYNLLVEIGENIVVILSTHIVEDVADLCPRMAVLAAGRIQLDGAPAELIQRCRGTVWAKTIERNRLDEMKAAYEVIATRLFAGRTIVHVLSDQDPGNGFELVEGGLEDVYLSTLTRARRTAAQKAA